VVDYDHSLAEICVASKEATLRWNLDRLYAPPSQTSNLGLIKIIAGHTHFLGLDSSGTVHVRGSNLHGQLGIGHIGKGCDEWTVNEAIQGLMVTDIAAGALHSLFVTQDGDVYSCGSNQYGQLGLSRTDNEESINYAEPSPVFESQPGDRLRVCAGTRHSLVWDDSGVVHGCGWNKYGQLLQSAEKQIFDRFIPVLEHKGGTVAAFEWFTVIMKSSSSL
jgi:alpha-tubulin suppressor-like RCC1 family protein